MNSLWTLGFRNVQNHEEFNVFVFQLGIYMLTDCFVRPLTDWNIDSGYSIAL